MAINNYSTLQTAVANWLDRSDLTSRIPEFITLAESRIARKLRVRAMETRSTANTVAGTQYYNLPTNFLEARNVQLNTNPITTLVYRTPEQLDEEYPYTTAGQPCAFTIIGTQMQLRPVPNGVYQIEYTYFKRFTALATTPTNWLTSNAPDLLLYGALIEAESYLVNDPRIAIWKAQYEQAIDEWNMSSAKGRHSGSHLEIRIAP